MGEYVAQGIDMMDCVLPSRSARHGLLFTMNGRMHIRRAEFRDDARPVDEKCPCYTCQTFSRAYLRHLFVAEEPLVMRLLTLHNLHYYLTLMRQDAPQREHPLRELLNGLR